MFSTMRESVGMRASVGTAVVAVLVTVATTALAAPCGDALDGRRVACRCGDTVVTDTRLLATDPVVTTRCATLMDSPFMPVRKQSR